jgi:hypothetical protein
VNAVGQIEIIEFAACSEFGITLYNSLILLFLLDCVRNKIKMQTQLTLHQPAYESGAVCPAPEKFSNE